MRGFERFDAQCSRKVCGLWIQLGVVCRVTPAGYLSRVTVWHYVAAILSACSATGELGIYSETRHMQYQGGYKNNDFKKKRKITIFLFESDLKILIKYYL